MKIDRSFINDAIANDLAMITGTIKMTHQLRLKVIGEGIETEKQLSILTNLDCDEVQGFYLGKGVSSDEVWRLINPK